VDLDKIKARLSATTTVLAVGKVRAVTGLSVRASLPGARIGDVVVIRRKGDPLLAEIVGFDAGEAVVLPSALSRASDPTIRSSRPGAPLEVRASDALLGRVLDGLGRPLDGGPAIEGTAVPRRSRAPPALGRRPVAQPLRRASKSSTAS